MDLAREESFVNSFICKVVDRIIQDAKWQEGVLKRKFELLEMMESSRFDDFERKMAEEMKLLDEQISIYSKYLDDEKSMIKLIKIVKRIVDRERSVGVLNPESERDYVMISDFLINFNRILKGSKITFTPPFIDVLRRQRKFLRKVFADKRSVRPRAYSKHCKRFSRNLSKELSLLQKLGRIINEHSNVIDPQVLTAQSYSMLISKPGHATERRRWLLKAGISALALTLLFGAKLAEHHLQHTEEAQLHANAESAYTLKLSNEEWNRRTADLHRLYERAGEVILLDHVTKGLDDPIKEIADERKVFVSKG
ncbi:MAG: hypothetical protein V1866_07020 [archaeon]